MPDEREQRFIDHVTSKLGKPIDERSLEFQTWKSGLGISDMNLFHEIAQAEGIKELGRDEWLYYRMALKAPQGWFDHWAVSLVRCRPEEFLERYGKLYRVADGLI